MADADNSYPCRISLTDAKLGEQVLLVHYEHHAVSSPFRSSYAIYVRQGEKTPDVGHIVDLFDAWTGGDDALRRKVFVDNPARCYDFSPLVPATAGTQ